MRFLPSLFVRHFSYFRVKLVCPAKIGRDVRTNVNIYLEKGIDSSGLAPFILGCENSACPSSSLWETGSEQIRDSTGAVDQPYLGFEESTSGMRMSLVSARENRF